MNADYYCPNCNTELKKMWYEDYYENDETTEIVCHCPNENCGLDWTLFINEDLEPVKIQRFFFG